MPKHMQDVVVDDVVGSTPPAEAARRDDSSRPWGSDAQDSSGAMEAQLQRVEARLIALAGADATLQADVRRYLTESWARFATARVRQFVPILVEREVRARLNAWDPPRGADRTA